MLNQIRYKKILVSYLISSRKALLSSVSFTIFVLFLCYLERGEKSPGQLWKNIGRVKKKITHQPPEEL